MTSQPSDIPPSGPTGPVAAPHPAPAPEAAGMAAGMEEKTARQLIDPLRQPGAFVLLLANGLIMLFAMMDLFVVLDDWPGSFLARAGSSFVEFVGVVSIGFPLLAVLLATCVKPRVAQARVVTVVALVEYGVSALFGALCLLVDFLQRVADSGVSLGISPARRAFEDLIVRAGEFTVLAVAALAVYQVFHGLYPHARQVPAHPPYGRGYPAGYAKPGQPPYPPGYGRQPGPGDPQHGGDGRPTQPINPPAEGEGPTRQWQRP